MESDYLKYRLHRQLSERIREGCEGRLNIHINPRWFMLGNIYPDSTHQRILHMHKMDAAGDMVQRMVSRFCGKRIISGQNISWWRSLRLGIVMHYVCDFSCYVHTSDFSGTLREHHDYEEQQGALTESPQMRDVCSFYGVKEATSMFNLFVKTLNQRDKESFSPSGDLDYALSIGTELAYAMLRICMENEPKTPLRYRIPYIGPRLQGVIS
jgi:hypothetical protein